MHQTVTEYPNTFTISARWHGESLSDEYAIGIVSFKDGGYYGYSILAGRDLSISDEIDETEIPITCYGMDY
jgi:hypothetical protein